MITKKHTWIMGRDQYGDTYHDLGRFPRAELLRRLDRKHAVKMYCDTKSGKTKHAGYVIAGRWIRIYRVLEWKAVS